MKRRLLPVVAGLVLLFVAYLPPAVAQNGDSADEENVPTEVAEPAEELDEPSEEGGGGEEGLASEEEGVPALGDEGSEKPPTILGPGGKELRSDYPGTEESLQPRMDTARIEGLDFNEGDGPEEVYDLRVRALETEIDDLKEKVFRSKSRIVLLKETVLSGNLAGSRAIIMHESRLSSTYKLRRALFSLDGSRLLNKLDRDGDLAGAKRMEVFNGSISPGNHNVSVLLGFQGSGYGVFSYAEGYGYELRGSCPFTAEEGKTTVIKVITYEKGNVFTAYEDRPDILCDVSVVELTPDDLIEEAAR